MEGSTKSQFISTFLDSPLIQNERDKTLLDIVSIRSGVNTEIHPASKAKIKLLLSVVGEDEILALDPDFYATFDKEMHPEDLTSELDQADKMKSTILHQASEGTRLWGSPSGLGITTTPYRDLGDPTVGWYNRMRMFEKIVQTIASSRANGIQGAMRVRSGNLFYVGDEYYGLIKIDHVAAWYMCTYNQLLMFKDLYYSRFNAMVSAWQIYRSECLLEAIADCLAWFFKCLAVYGNKGYELGKGIEALAKANLIRREDPVLGLRGSYDEQLSGMISKEQKWGKRNGFVVMELDSILRRDIPLPEIVEIFGLQKLSGHPLIDPAFGGASVREESKKKINYSYTNVGRLRNSCCRLYTEGFIRKERSWPPLTFSGEAKKTKLYQLYSLGERKINRSSYPLEDWENVRFLQHKEFDYYPNFTDLMDDKAISFYRDEAAATWDSKITPRSNKRLLLEMLSRPEISVFEIVERVRSGDIPYSWLIVTLYPKEREFKLAARMFSMMVFEMRAYFTATEANLADHVFPYLPQQTMTLPKQEIQELFHKVTAPAGIEHLERLFLEIDLTRWNLRWHPEVIDPIGQDINDMFGLPGTYTAIHHFFKRCMILIRVPVCKPPGIELEHPPESDLLFYDHEVGFEGIGQKLWTLATYSMIDLGAGAFAYNYHLIGQADNQIVLMSIDCSDATNQEDHLRGISETIKSNIQKECQNVGQEAKPEECLESTTVVTYSKDIYIRGVEYHTSVKAHSRIFPHSASDFPSVDASIGAISGQCLSAAEKTKQPFHSFVLWCFHAALYLYRIKDSVFVETSLLGDRVKDLLTDRNIYGLLILPSELGGTQVAPLASFFYKGGADPLSKAYASLKFYQKISPLCRKMIYALNEGVWFDKDKDLNILLDDPFGLPLQRPTTAENSVLSSSKARVNVLAKNREIHELTSASVIEYEERLRKILQTCTPFNPVLLSDILGWSVVGVLDQISRMFTSTRTLQSLIQGDEESGVCGRILASGSGHFVNTLLRINSLRTGEKMITDIYSEVNHLRSFWTIGRDIELVGVTSYVPFDLPLVVEDCPPNNDGFRSVADVPLTDSPLHERGDSEPYLGRATAEKRSQHGYKIVTSSAPERAVKRLADIGTQPGVSISFKKLVAEVAKSRANVDLNALYPLIGVGSGGTIIHRFISRFGNRSANTLGMLSFASKCYLSNDSAAPISGGEDDIPIMVQEMMVCQIGILAALRLSHPGAIFCTLRTDSKEWRVLDDRTVEVNSYEDLNTPFFSANRIATVDFIQIDRFFGPLSSPFITALPSVETTDYSPTYAMRRIIGRSLEGAHSALAVADIGTGVVSLKFDLLEIRGVGMRNTVECASLEICLTVIETIFTKSYSELRWTPTPLITTLSSAVSRSLVQYFLHPMFRKDTYVQKLLRISPLKYSFAGETPAKRLRDAIARRALSLFSDPTSQVYTEKEIIYADDKSSLSSRLIVRRLKAILTQGIMTDQIQVGTASAIMRRHIPRALRSEPSEKGRLGSLFRMIVCLERWSDDNGLFFLQEQLLSLYRGERIYKCQVPATELIRKARSIIPQETAIMGEIQDYDDNLLEWDMSMLKSRSNISKHPFSEIGVYSNSYSLDPYGPSLERLRGRVYGGESAAGYSYLSIARLSRDKVCVIVGCGYGSGASVLLSRGASLVLGVDLWSDCPIESTIMGLALPPAITAHSRRDRFVRIPVSPRQTGDIKQAGTASLLKQHVGAGALYFIDVPVTEPDDLLHILTTCSLLSHPVTVIIRLIGSEKVFQEVAATLKFAGMTVRVYPVFTCPKVTEGWIEITMKAVFRIEPRLVLPYTSTRCPIVDLGSPSWLGGGREDLMQSIEGPYYGLPDEMAADGGRNINRLMDMSVGDLHHRFTFDQWSEIIGILLLRDTLAKNSPFERCKELLGKDMITLNLGIHSIPVALTRSIKFKISRTWSRLL